MFRDASSFNQPLDRWNTSNVNYMARMFMGASRFNQCLVTWNVHNVVDMEEMFDADSQTNLEILKRTWPQLSTMD